MAETDDMCEYAVYIMGEVIHSHTHTTSVKPYINMCLKAAHETLVLICAGHRHSLEF